MYRCSSIFSVCRVPIRSLPPCRKAPCSPPRGAATRSRHKAHSRKKKGKFVARGLELSRGARHSQAEKGHLLRPCAAESERVRLSDLGPRHSSWPRSAQDLVRLAASALPSNLRGRNMQKHQTSTFMPRRAPSTEICSHSSDFLSLQQALNAGHPLHMRTPRLLQRTRYSVTQSGFEASTAVP